MSEIPNTADLLINSPKNWGRWGAGDELGAANLLTPDVVLAAASTIRSGKVFTLGTEFGNGDDPIWPGRAQAQRYNTQDRSAYTSGKKQSNPGGTEYADDYIAMFLQGATHYDGLGHVWYDNQIYNGFPADSTILGMDKGSVLPLARKGVVGRGVLVDIARYFGKDYLDKGEAVELADVLGCLEKQQVEITPGNILLVRTGEIGSFKHRDPQEFYADFIEPGLNFSPELVQWFADNDIVSLATDTIGNERTVHQSGAAFVLHAALMRNLGVAFAEILSLDELAADCAEDGQYDFFYAAAPLKVEQGTGAPVNPMAIK
jgi:kynurenine formamidase